MRGKEKATETAGEKEGPLFLFPFLSSCVVPQQQSRLISLRGTLRLPIFMAATICTNISNDDSPPFACVGVTGLLSSRLFLFLIFFSHLTLSSESKWCDHITTLLQCDTREGRGTSHGKGRREEEAVVWWWDSTRQSLTIVVVSSTLRVTVYLLKSTMCVCTSRAGILLILPLYDSFYSFNGLLLFPSQSCHVFFFFLFSSPIQTFPYDDWKENYNLPLTVSSPLFILITSCQAAKVEEKEEDNKISLQVKKRFQHQAIDTQRVHFWLFFKDLHSRLTTLVRLTEQKAKDRQAYLESLCDLILLEWRKKREISLYWVTSSRHTHGLTRQRKMLRKTF